MLTEFSRTMRALDGDSFGRTTVFLLLSAVLLAAWLTWFFAASVAVYEVSPMARIESGRAVHPVDAPISGTVVLTRLELGREVKEGEVLVELGAEREALELKEAQQRLDGLSPQLEAIRRELETQVHALEPEREAARASLDEADARAREAEVAADLADQEVKRIERLEDSGLVSEADLERARAEAEQRRATAESLRLALERIEPESRTRQRDREARLDQLRREAARIESEIATTTATVRRLANRVQERFLKAPATGNIVEAADLESGTFVHEGERLGVVLGKGGLEVVAAYAPASALGRIRPGQTARVRLDGFPSAQYGSLAATVALVSSELRDGKVRVELEVHPESNLALPLQHGLPASTEIEIEKVSPATLLLRAAGRLVTAAPGAGAR